MYTRLSPEESEHVFSLCAEKLDPVDLHFLKTSESIDLEDVSTAMSHLLKRSEERDFTLINEFGPVKIGVLRLKDQYFEYFKKTDLVGLEGSIVFYTRACGRVFERCLIWPLMSESMYMLDEEMISCEAGRAPFYEQKVVLGKKSEQREYHGHPFEQEITFARVYRTDKRCLFGRAIRSVSAQYDLVIHEGRYKDETMYCDRLSKTQKEDPMWLVRHQDEVKFAGYIHIPPYRTKAVGAGGVIEE